MHKWGFPGGPAAPNTGFLAPEAGVLSSILGQTGSHTLQRRSENSPACNRDPGAAT